jgi:two-component system sensor histidine kinase UhpB
MNGVLFALGTAVLAFSPATVSSPVVLTEAVVLALGLAAILVANALLLRRTLVPLDRLARRMDSVDLLQPGERLPEAGSAGAVRLTRAFNTMLERLEAERASGVARALAAQERERRRIARELHDEVGQSLTAVLLDLGRRGQAAELGGATETVRATLDEVRRIASRLRPGVLDDLGLLSALSSLAGDLGRLTGARVVRELDPATPALSPEADLVVYRIAQEACTNIARHAEAAEVHLGLAPDGDRVVLRVSDDGRGVGGSPAGAGILGMRERALLIGAKLQVGPAPGGGTLVRLDVPAGAR